jgi:xanthine dehydrogenase accessory factor
MFDAFLAKANELYSADNPFAMAIVVNYDPPVSGKPGDKAIIQSDGSVWGWIGGGCVQPLVVREALKAIQERSPRLVRIAPSEKRDQETGTVQYSMSCHGGGSLAVYIEPVLPKKKLLIFGRSMAAQCLSKLGKTVGYTIAVFAPKARLEQFPDAEFIGEEFSTPGMRVTSETSIVVATQGEQDQEALETALRTDARYISFIASRAKAQKVIALLSARGLPSQMLSRIKAPAGLDIGASAPEEIAVSILAEIIRAGKGPVSKTSPLEESEQERASLGVTDPVCGMTVDIGESGLSSQYAGRSYYFCCSGCKQAFDMNPEKYKDVGALQDEVGSSAPKAHETSAQGGA